MDDDNNKHPSDHPESSSAEVVITRRKTSLGFNVDLRVIIDDEHLATVANGESVTVRVTPGHHVVAVSGPTNDPKSASGNAEMGIDFRAISKPLEFEVQAGENIELVCQSALLRCKIWRPESSLSSPAGPPVPSVGTVVEGSRYEVKLGDERRTIDNSRSSSSTTRTVRLSREWSRTFVVDLEHTTSRQDSMELRIHFVSLKAAADRTLRQKYSITAEKRETFEEEVTFTIPPRTRSVIIFSWKEIRQKGTVQISEDDLDAAVPYEIVVGLTFDQEQIDDVD
jgi:hypothetical protein